MAEMQELKADFDVVVGEIKDLLAKQREEINETGETSKETREALSKLEGKHDGAYQKMRERMDSLEKEMKRPVQPATQTQKSLGETFVSSEEYKTYDKRTKSNPCHVGSFSPYMQSKAVSSSNAGVLVEEYRMPGIIVPPDRPLRIRDLLPAMRTSSDTVEYVEESSFNQLYTEVATEAASGQADVVVDNAQGFFAGQEILIETGTPVEAAIDSVDLDTNTLTLTANLSAVVAVDTAVSATTFVFTPELQIKPMTNAEFALSQESVKTLAHWIPLSRQIVADAPMLQDHINRRLMTGIKLSEEQQILYGNGGNTELQGIMTHSGVQSYSWSSGVYGDTRIDAIRRAITVAQLAHYPVDGIIVHPTDWEYIELAKGDDAHYIQVLVSDGRSMMLWRVPVVVTSAMASGQFLLGSFQLGSTLWDREMAEIRISDSHEDYFTRNMLAILAEERLALTIERPESFVVGAFDSAPAEP